MWQETKKKGVFRHDDARCCEVEIIAYRCLRDDCTETRTVYHRLACKDGTPGHETATAEERKLYATCTCGAQMVKA